MCYNNTFLLENVTLLLYYVEKSKIQFRSFGIKIIILFSNISYNNSPGTWRFTWNLDLYTILYIATNVITSSSHYVNIEI